MKKSGGRNKSEAGPSVRRASSARRAAFEILRRVEEEGAFAAPLLASVAEELRADDRALCYELVLGVLRRQLWLDRLAEMLSGRAAETLDAPVRRALRLGLYQLRFLSRIPASAAVNESVNLVYEARVRSAAGFVNAVLRRAAREPGHEPAERASNEFERIAVETSHPVWLVERWAEAFGAEEAEKFARANNETPPVAFRVNTMHADTDEVVERLRASGVAVEASSIAPGAWRVKAVSESEPPAVAGGHDWDGRTRPQSQSPPATAGGSDLSVVETAGKGGGRVLRELAAGGLIYLQDEASQLVAHVLGARAGERVLDACAAPGSKTTHAALLCDDAALIVAGDRHAHRLRVLRESAARQSLKSINTLTLDAEAALPFPDSTFDRVLVDAPCTGTGTLRHNPEIRWRIKPADVDELAARQSRILENASRAVRGGGGRLVYSTCSVEREENERVVEAFLSNNIDFRNVTETTAAKNFLEAPGAGARTWPQRDGADGFFVAAFERVS